MPRFTIRRFPARGPIYRLVRWGRARGTADVPTNEKVVIRKIMKDTPPVVGMIHANGAPSEIESPGSSLKNHTGKETKTIKLPTPIRVVQHVSELRRRRRTARSEGKRIALVPTMGALHAGHIKLIREAAENNDEVYISIYVNPTQFGVHEDLDSYPRTWESDLDKLRSLNRDIKHRRGYRGLVTTVFKPSTPVMYPTLPPTSEPNGHGSFVHITPLSSVLEGASRPVFFRGVATVVMKLLNIVQPDEVFFGQKDIQQVLVIRRLVADFHINTVMQAVSTQRELDGLAMSSRNVNLGKRRRAVAPVLYQALNAALKAFESGKRTRDEILAAAIDVAAKTQQWQRNLPPGERARFEVDYLSMADPDSLKEVEVIEEGKPVILSGALVMLPLEEPKKGENVGATAGATAVRLIDNVIFYRGKLFPQSPNPKRLVTTRPREPKDAALDIQSFADELSSTDRPVVSV